VRISSSNAGYTMFRGSVKGTSYPPHSPVSPSLPLLCVTVCHHISTGVYRLHGVLAMGVGTRSSRRWQSWSNTAPCTLPHARSKRVETASRNGFYFLYTYCTQVDCIWSTTAVCTDRHVPASRGNVVLPLSRYPFILP